MWDFVCSPSLHFAFSHPQSTGSSLFSRVLVSWDSLSTHLSKPGVKKSDRTINIHPKVWVGLGIGTHLPCWILNELRPKLPDMPSVNEANPRFCSETRANLSWILLQQWSGHTSQNFMMRQKLTYISLRVGLLFTEIFSVKYSQSHQISLSTCVHMCVCKGMLVIFYVTQARVIWKREPQLRINPYHIGLWGHLLA